MIIILIIIAGYLGCGVATWLYAVALQFREDWESRSARRNAPFKSSLPQLTAAPPPPFVSFPTNREAQHRPPYKYSFPTNREAQHRPPYKYSFLANREVPRRQPYEYGIITTVGLFLFEVIGSSVNWTTLPLYSGSKSCWFWAGGVPILFGVVVWLMSRNDYHHAYGPAN
jgi:hypothetical protein